MAIAASPATPTFTPSSSSSSFYYESTRLPLPFSPSLRRSRSPPSTLRLPLSSRLKPSENGDLQYQLHHGVSPHRCPGSPVYVTLPIDAVTPAVQLRRKKAMDQSFRALAAAGVEGVVMEVWWGLVEKEFPRVYNWHAYLDIVHSAKRFGLKVRALMAFHQCGNDPSDPNWIPLPQWVLEEMDKDQDLAFSDRFGRRNMEYISLGCDTLPVLQGRSPIQAYSDFMRNFRDAFRPFLGVVITGIQVGMGPAGELRYPSRPSQKLTWPWRSHELGEFQCYDKYMLGSLNACAWKIGMMKWGNGGPICASNLMHELELTEFFKSDGSWNTPYGQFFLEWYSGMLLLHGERMCKEAKIIFHGIEVNLLAKIVGIHWHYRTKSHPSELTAGYYNTAFRDGYLPIARLFGRYSFALCCSCFEKQDSEQLMDSVSGPESFLQQLLLVARICGISLVGENASLNPDDGSFEQVLKMSRLCSDGVEKPSFSFNFVRMDKNLFESHKWVRFTRFVRQMSNARTFRTQLAFKGDIKLSSTSAATRLGLAFAC